MPIFCPLLMMVIGLFSPSVLATKDGAVGLINLTIMVLFNLAVDGQSGLSFLWLLGSLEGAFICTGKWLGVPLADYIPGFIPPAIMGLDKFGLNCPVPTNKTSSSQPTIPQEELTFSNNTQPAPTFVNTFYDNEFYIYFMENNTKNYLKYVNIKGISTSAPNQKDTFTYTTNTADAAIFKSGYRKDGVKYYLMINPIVSNRLVRFFGHMFLDSIQNLNNFVQTQLRLINDDKQSANNSKIGNYRIYNSDNTLGPWRDLYKEEVVVPKGNNQSLNSTTNYNFNLGKIDTYVKTIGDSYTYDEAVQQCENAGARLCSISEINNKNICTPSWTSDKLLGRAGCGGSNGWRTRGANPNSKGSALCCKKTNPNSNYVKTIGTFPYKYTYDQAKQQCENIGARLCSKAEITDRNICNNGWTSDGVNGYPMAYGRDWYYGTEVDPSISNKKSNCGGPSNGWRTHSTDVNVKGSAHCCKISKEE